MTSRVALVLLPLLLLVELLLLPLLMLLRLLRSQRKRKSMPSMVVWTCSVVVEEEEDTKLLSTPSIAVYLSSIYHTTLINHSVINWCKF
jgi:hypothetical protein